MLLYQIVDLLIESAAALFGSALLMRAWMQRARVGGRGNPLSNFVIALTNPIVLPLRRLIPGARGIDWASIVGAFLVALIALVALQLALLAIGVASGFPNPVALLLLALVSLLRWAIYTVMLITIVWVVLSWVNPYAPLAPFVESLVAPLLAPFRRVLPTIGGVDLSPLGLFVALQIALLVVGELGRRLPGTF